MGENTYYENLRHKYSEQYSFTFLDKNEKVTCIGTEWKKSVQEAFSDGVLHSVLHNHSTSEETMLIVSDCECRSTPPYFTRDTLVDCFLWHDPWEGELDASEKSYHQMILEYMFFNKLPECEDECY